MSKRSQKLKRKLNRSQARQVVLVKANRIQRLYGRLMLLTLEGLHTGVGVRLDRIARERIAIEKRRLRSLCAKYRIQMPELPE
jgi:hypothetical protein